MIKMSMNQNYASVADEKKDIPSYPSINLYSSSRVFNQRVNNAKLPLLKYR